MFEDGRVPFDMEGLTLVSISFNISEGHIGVKFVGVYSFDWRINVSWQIGRVLEILGNSEWDNDFR